MDVSIGEWLPVVGRIFMSVIFLMGGISKIKNVEGTKQYMASKKMPAIPFFLLGAVIVELSGGLSLLTGFKANYGALILFLFLIPTTFIFHNFWVLSGEERQTQLINFQKNLAIMGGLLYVVAFETIAL